MTLSTKITNIILNTPSYENVRHVVGHLNIYKLTLSRFTFTYELVAMIKVKHPSFTPTQEVGIVSCLS